MVLPFKRGLLLCRTRVKLHNYTHLRKMRTFNKTKKIPLPSLYLVRKGDENKTHKRLATSTTSIYVAYTL